MSSYVLRLITKTDFPCCGHSMIFDPGATYKAKLQGVGMAGSRIEVQAVCSVDLNKSAAHISDHVSDLEDSYMPVYITFHDIQPRVFLALLGSTFHFFYFICLENCFSVCMISVHMAATDMKIARICTESRTASNGISSGIQNLKKPKQIELLFPCLSNLGF